MTEKREGIDGKRGSAITERGRVNEEKEGSHHGKGRHPKPVMVSLENKDAT
jgi:hypothetical protein